MGGGRNQWLPIEIITSATTTHSRHSGACDCLAKPWYKLVIAEIRKAV